MTLWLIRYILFVPHHVPFYTQTAFQIIQDHPQVITDRVGILGLSFGTSVALTVAAYSQISRVRIECIYLTHFHDDTSCISFPTVTLF